MRFVMVVLKDFFSISTSDGGERLLASDAPNNFKSAMASGKSAETEFRLHASSLIAMSLWPVFVPKAQKCLYRPALSRRALTPIPSDVRFASLGQW